MKRLIAAVDILKNISHDNEHLSLREVVKDNGDQEQSFEMCGQKALLCASIENARLVADE